MTTENKHKVAIITVTDNYLYNVDDYSVVIDKISNWEFVTDEELQLLLKGQHGRSYCVIQEPKNLREFIDFTVQKELEIIREQEEKNRLRREEYQKRMVANEEKKNQRKLKQLQKLQAEVGHLVENNDESS